MLLVTNYAKNDENINKLFMYVGCYMVLIFFICLQGLEVNTSVNNNISYLNIFYNYILS